MQILLLLHVLPKPLSCPLSGDMDHKADHPTGFAVTKLMAFIRLYGGHERPVVHRPCVASYPISLTVSLSTALEMLLAVIHRGACGRFHHGWERHIL